jgi:hypothetical protein
MGNNVSFDFDEFHMKFAYIHDGEPPSALRNSKYIKWSHLEIDSLKFLIAKILLTDMQEKVIGIILKFIC